MDLATRSRFRFGSESGSGEEFSSGGDTPNGEAWQSSSTAAAPSKVLPHVKPGASLSALPWEQVESHEHEGRSTSRARANGDNAATEGDAGGSSDFSSFLLSMLATSAPASAPAAKAPSGPETLSVRLDPTEMAPPVVRCILGVRTRVCQVLNIYSPQHYSLLFAVGPIAVAAQVGGQAS